MRNKYITGIALTVMLSVACCTENQECEPLTGDMVGYVKLFNSREIEVADRSGATITADNGVKQVTVTTDVNGRYVFSGLETGSYNIIYNKEGYCQHMKPGVQFIGGDLPAYSGVINIYALEEVVVSNLVVADLTPMSGDVFLQLQYTMSGTLDDMIYLRYYVARGHEVSDRNYLITGYNPTFVSDGKKTFYLNLERDLFPPGSEVSLIIYPATEYKNYYIDIETGIKVYTSINHANASNALNVTIPAK